MFELFLYLTIQDGKWDEFLSFEEEAERTMVRFNGQLKLRFVDSGDSTLHEYHYLTFASEQDFEDYTGFRDTEEINSQKEELFKGIHLVSEMVFLDLALRNKKK